jgi:hypothetical protein
MIGASNQEAALRTYNLLLSAAVVYEGAIGFQPPPFHLDHLSVEGTKEKRPFAMAGSSWLRASEIAAQASRNRSFCYALHKVHLSLRSASPNHIDLSPGSGLKVFRVHRDTFEHVHFANAITLAYSAIEELGLDVRVRPGESSRLADGAWNPRVRSDLEARLRQRKIPASETHLWIIRGGPTRIETRRSPKGVAKPDWAWGPAVRDTELLLIDAIAYASWLRSKVTTHKFSSAARSLTGYDVHNVQSLARRLLLGRLGLWLRLMTC